MKILCVYCTRTGHTEKAAKRLCEGLDATLAVISDGKSRKGALGYIAACFKQLSGRLPRLLPLKTDAPLCDYEKIIICAPVWCEDICCLAKAFLAENRDSINGEIHIVATHMSGISYEGKIRKTSELSGREISSFLSVKTRKNDYLAEIDAYRKTLAD